MIIFKKMDFQDSSMEQEQEIQMLKRILDSIIV